MPSVSLPVSVTRFIPLMVCVALATLDGCVANKPMRVCMEGDLKTSLKNDNNVTPVCARALPGQPKGLPRIALIDVDGLLVNRNLTGMQSMGENPVALFREKLRAAQRDPCVVAVVLRVNSPGGGVTASDIMRWELQQFRERSCKPVVACLMDVGAGGAYYVTTAADVIVAHPTTITGGIGVILNLYDLQDAMSQQNILQNAIRSGEKIDMGTSTRALEEDEAEILERIAKEFHMRFRSAVVMSRPGMEEAEQVPTPGQKETESLGEDLFDGRVFTASEALRHGLIDQIGYLEDALATARSLAGASATRTIVYRRNNDRALTAYDITPNVPGGGFLSISIPGLDRSLLPTFLYLWQPEPLFEKTGGP